jgi:exopolyphosphatase / guanosine-5'-triphosphate,3'-diphosphate pyrophosphatase
MDDKIAIIDLGTNTFHLMLAQSHTERYRILHQERVPVKIGLGGINSNIITDAGIARAVEAMKNFEIRLDQNNVSKVYAFGTSALRNASNGKEVVEKIETETGIGVRIISGDEEADYIYQGVRAAVTMKETSLIVDIGGGSVEFIIGNHEEILWKESFEIGAQRLLERFQKNDPILVGEIKELKSFLKLSLPSLSNAIEEYKPQVLIGSSGTFDTLSEIHCTRNGLRYDPAAPETPLSFKSFHEIFNELIIKNRTERLQIPGMIEMRVDMIVVACCLIDYLLDSNTDFQSLRVSSYSLKEGVLASLCKL